MESEFQILSHLRAPVCVLDCEFRIIICNSSFVKLCLCPHSGELKNQELGRVFAFKKFFSLEKFKTCKLEETIFSENDF